MVGGSGVGGVRGCGFVIIHAIPSPVRFLKMPPKTMFEKIWDAHVVHQNPGQDAILYVDLHLVHEVTSPQAFEGLRAIR